MVFRFVFLAVSCLTVAACASGYSNRLNVELVQSLKLRQVDVSVAPDADFWWGDGERAYARSIGRPEAEAEALGASPEGRNFMRARASQSIKTAFDRSLAGKLNGTRPVRVVVTMRAVHVASAAQRIIVGGNHTMTASVNLVDANTGEVIASNPKISVTAGAGQGIAGAVLDSALRGDPMDGLASQLADSFSFWLMPPAPRA